MVKLSRYEKNEIVEAIREAERGTSGEIRVHLKDKCGGDILAESKKIFHKLRMHRTKHRNGVLIVIAFQDRKFSILGDAGIHRHAGDDFWSQTRDAMAHHFSKGEMKEGILTGIRKAGSQLKKHFPAETKNRNELPDNVSGGS